MRLIVSHASSLPFHQQRSDENAFFGQKWFGIDEASIISRAVFVTVSGENCRAHGKRSGRFDACYAWFSDCGKRLLVPAQTKTCQAERRSCLPVPRLLSHKQL